MTILLQLKTRILPVNALPVNPRATLKTTLPDSPQLNAELKSYTFKNNSLYLHCYYTANWNFPIANLEVQGNLGSEDFKISNVTYTTFDIVINSSSYANASTNNGGYFMVTTTGWGQWQSITSTIAINENITANEGTININASINGNINITTTQSAS